MTSDGQNGHSTESHDGDEHVQSALREQRAAVRHFMIFFGVWIALAIFFLLVNIASGSGVWFFWPMLPLMIPLIFLAWRAFAMPRVGDAFVERRMEERGSRARPGSTARSATAVRPVSGDHAATINEAAELIDSIRGEARQVQDSLARNRVLNVAAASDRVLSAVTDYPGETQLASEFVERYLRPANKIVREYVRLSTGNVRSAQATLRQVEDHDLPQLETKFDDIYDRLHRGSVIDLQVAREMLSMDLPESSLDQQLAEQDGTIPPPSAKRSSTEKGRETPREELERLSRERDDHDDA